MKTKIIFLLVTTFFLKQTLKAQTTAFGDELNVVTSALPMLAIGPDARMGGLANAGVAASPDANALFWNPSKLAFTS